MRFRTASRNLFVTSILLVCANTVPAAPPVGKALVYVIQGSTGSFANVLVWVDGRSLGSLVANSYLVVAVGPGTHEVSTAGSQRASLTIAVGAGETRYVQQQLDPQGVPQIRELGEAQARQVLTTSRAVHDEPVVMGDGTRVPTPTPTRAPTAASPGGSSNTIIVKAGSFQLSNGSQDFLATTQQFDTKSKSVFGIEYEWRPENDFSVGGEYCHYRNSFVETGSTFSGNMDVNAFMVNVKKYFELTSVFRPYVGAGAGFASAKLSGDFTGTGSGVGYQGMAGIEIRMRSIGIYTEMKYLSAKAKDSNGETLKVSGKGPFIGMSVHF